MHSTNLPYSSKDGDRKFKPAYATRRFTKRSYALLGIIVIGLLYYFNTNATESTKLSNIPSYTPQTTKPKDGKLRIAIVTLTTQQRSYSHVALENKWQYAYEHGYDLIVDYKNMSPKSPVWHKLIMLENAYHKDRYDWIWWIDFDTLVTNMTVKLEDIINEYATPKTDMILTADCFPLNAGSMLVKATPRLEGYIAQIRACGDKQEYSEQDCLRDQIKDEQYEEKGIVVMAPQWKMNAFPEEIRCLDKYDKVWKRGMFLVHFAGAWAHVKGDDPTGQMFHKYAPEIVYSS